jgi:hypothetical protein
MPPQTPESSQSDFDFMLKQQSQNQSSGKLSNLGKPAKILVAAVLALAIAIGAALLLGGSDSNSQQVLDLMAQNQEIVRVSEAQEQKFKDANTKDFSATTQAVLASQKFQMGDYLNKSGVKYNEKQLAVKKNSSTDTQLQTAAQNNNLESAYLTYLKTSLTAYSNSLSQAFQAADSQTLKGTLQSAYSSLQTLLNSPQLKS